MTNLKGGCGCGAVRYHLKSEPMIVHACHCTDCQKATGAAFAINMWIEEDRVEIESGSPSSKVLDTPSGKGCEIFFCETCGSSVWSKYLGAPGKCLFVRAGMLDDPSVVTPDVHIYTCSKVPWLNLADDAKIFDVYYDKRDVWSADSQARMRANIEKSKT